jgi:rhodanese-related sulfurtransferase
MNTPRTPFGRALRESRGILIGAFLVALTFNLFASSGLPWVASTPELESASLDEFNTTAQPAPPAVDTVNTMIPQALPGDSLRTVQMRDSIANATRLAEAEKARVADSITKAKEAAKQSQTPTPAPADPAPGTIAPAAREINSETAKAVFDEKKAVFIDARTAEEFAKGHIPDAINVYANDFQTHIPALLQLQAKRGADAPVVAYCGGGLCELSHELADQLVLLGFRRVFVYTGGTQEWTSLGHPFTGK